MIIVRLKSFFDDDTTLNQRKIIINSAIDTIEALRAENARLKELLNDGHTSMIKENEQLKWACAAKDADNTMMRSILKRLVRDARAAMGESDV